MRLYLWIKESTSSSKNITGDRVGWYRFADTVIIALCNKFIMPLRNTNNVIAVFVHEEVHL